MAAKGAIQVVVANINTDVIHSTESFVAVQKQ
jgi:hypothetical protein